MMNTNMGINGFQDDDMGFGGGGRGRPPDLGGMGGFDDDLDNFGGDDDFGGDDLGGGLPQGGGNRSGRMGGMNPMGRGMPDMGGIDGMTPRMGRQRMMGGRRGGFQPTRRGRAPKPFRQGGGQFDGGNFEDDTMMSGGRGPGQRAEDAWETDCKCFQMKSDTTLFLVTKSSAELIDIPGNGSEAPQRRRSGIGSEIPRNAMLGQLQQSMPPRPQPTPDNRPPPPMGHPSRPPPPPPMRYGIPPHVSMEDVPDLGGPSGPPPPPPPPPPGPPPS